MMRVQIGPRTWGEVTQEEYEYAIALSVVWAMEGMDREAACELAAHQLKIIACMRNNGSRVLEEDK